MLSFWGANLQHSVYSGGCRDYLGLSVSNLKRIPPNLATVEIEEKGGEQLCVLPSVVFCLGR